MKKRIFTFMVSLVTIAAGAQAQVAINATNFPDANFRNWLLDANNIKGYGADGQLTALEIADIQEIDVANKGIADLTGIANFTALEKLYLEKNSLTSLNITALTQLKVLYLSENPLTTIDLSKNTALEHLSVVDNPLTSLDLTKNTVLEQLSLSGNPISSLDLTKNLKLKYLNLRELLTSLDLPILNQLETFNLIGCKLPTFDLRKIHSPNCNMWIENCEFNSVVATGNTMLVGETLQKFRNCKLGAVDFSGCTGITELSFDDSQIKSLNVSNCPALRSLGCSRSGLKTLNASGCTAMKWLHCSGNELTFLPNSLDISGLPALTWFSIHSNNIHIGPMQYIIENLPDRSAEAEHGGLFVIDENDPNEGNVITKDQVAAARLKGWFVYHWLEGSVYTDYEGVDTGISTIENEQTIDHYYTLDGHKMNDMPAQKGIYVVNGKKVVIK